MPSKRTNDSVDAILQDLDHQQTAASVQGDLTDRQVDDILRSMGVLDDHMPAGQLGPVDVSALPTGDLIGAGLPVAEDRFSTAALDDILADLPSMRSKQPAAAPAPVRAAVQTRSAPALSARPAPSAQPAAQQAAPAPQPAQSAQPARPAPSARPSAQQTAPAQQPAKRPVAAQPVQPAPQPAPQPVQTNTARPAPQPADRAAPRPAPQPADPAPAQPEPAAPAAAPYLDDTNGDTTRTGIIKGFLRKMGGEDADQSALNQGKNQFQRFFEESAAVLPDEKGHLQSPAKKKRGLFGLGSVEDTDEFVPINVSLTGSHTEPAEDAARPEDEPEPPKKRGLLARLFGGRKEEQSDELYIPESRDIPETREEDAPVAPRAGITFSDEDSGLLPEIEPLPEATMQLPKGSIRSKYTAGPGAGLSSTLADIGPAADAGTPPAGDALRPQQDTLDGFAGDGFAGLDIGTTGEVSLSATASRDPFGGLYEDDTTLAFFRRAMNTKPAAPPVPPTSGPTVYRRAGSRPARRRYTAPSRDAAPQPAPAEEPMPEAYGIGPVGEPLMTTRDDIPAVPPQSAPAPEAPAYTEPVYTGPADTEPAYTEPAYTEPAYTEPTYTEPAVSSGFTVQMDLGTQTEDTAMFLSAYGQARDRHKPAAAPVPAEPAAPAAPELEAPTLEPIDERPTVERIPVAPVAPDAAAEITRTETGVIRLTAPEPAAADAGNVAAQALSAARAAAQPSDFVQNIAQSINDETAGKPSIRLGDTTGELPLRDAEYYQQAAEILTDTNSDIPEKLRERGPRLDGTPADEVQETATMPPFTAAPKPTRHAYDKPDDAPAVRRDLERQVLVLTVSAIVSGVIALVLLYLGTAARSGGWLPAGLDVQAGKTPLLVVHLVLLLAAMGICWRTMLEGTVGLLRSPSPDTMPVLAALGALVQLVVMLIRDGWYDPARFGLVTGLAVLVLCLNTVGKAIDARTLLGGFELVSAKVDHAVAYRLKDSSMLRAATRGLAEGRPCVLVSRPTELFKGFLSGAAAHRTSDKNQQQFAWALGVCALLALAFNLAYHRDVGLAVSSFAAVLCLGAPLAGTLISALPARLMQRSAARIGAVIPGWRDIRLLGRINVIRVTARDLFPDGCVKLCGIKPVRKEDIDRAIIYAASMLANGCQTLQDVFLGMIGDNRKLLAKVDDFQDVYGKGYVGWINGERVIIGSRALMQDYEIGLPSLEYEQKHTVNQRRVIYLAVSGKLFSMFQIAYQRDTDTAYVLDSLRRTGISLVVDAEDFNCDAVLLEAVYGLSAGVVKVLSAEERATLEPATAWLPESEGSMLHLGSFASFVGGLEAAAGAAEGERRASAVLTGAVLLSCVLGIVLSVTGGIVELPLPAMVLYQAAWAVLALVFPLLQHY